MNPWNLTAREAQVLDTIIKTGSGKCAAMELGISPITVSALMHRAAVRTGSRTRLHLALKWDRWSREHQETKAEAVLSDGTAPGGDLQVSGV